MTAWCKGSKSLSQAKEMTASCKESKSVSQANEMIASVKGLSLSLRPKR